ncbi:sugar transferase [Hoylesella saccharolytica]|uniref:sugar transferase n=1 Tax=Hoylesella saccharolytica TaxID=633701 RepID=UPI00047048FC|nr:sugar transferase [Hoylesella saccharolytica]
MLVKWIFDRVVSFIGIVVLLPVYIAIACLIKIKMPEGKVLFRQKRVGKNGKLFTMYKFRTMLSDPVKDVSVSAAEKSRITPLGSKLRKYKLDELPELWNVLTGDMSFVGPRPDVPGYADVLTGDSRSILKLRPGITGPASLKYRNEEDLLEKIDNKVEYNNNVIYPDKIRINLYYYKNYSFIKDLQMILCTITGTKMMYGGEII